ncbi:GGDEF domain-containing protein [Halonatronum saccharophilum]|uniref:GGDEF domain-containing protein n=1 Tax=Halonatronum saccharophilum TaxID=150060 RepID=UPI000481A7A6|nr:GGDEF domain-containing protein [Halonatronum saccharophilum]
MFYYLILTIILLVIINFKSAKKVNYYKQRAERMYQRAIKDGMTGLYNYEYFLSELEKSNSPYSLIMFDIDNFKQINDQYGHQVGDLVIKDIAAKAEGVIRKTDLLARYGGDEFIMALFDCSPRETKVVLNKLHSHINRASILVEGEEVSFAVSIGVYDLDDGIRTKEALKRVDLALYKAKREGKNCTVCY